MKTIITATILFLLGNPISSKADLVVPLGEKKVSFEVIQSPVGGRGPLFVSLHSNELNSVAAARQLIRSRAGTLIMIRNGGKRRISFDGGKSVDPNRVFSSKGVARDLNRFSRYSAGAAKKATAFGSGVSKKLGFGRGRPVIALHNNTNGGYSINSYKSGGSEAAAAAQVHVAAGKDPDNFFLVTHSKLFKDLKKAGFNVVLQANRGAPDDGSLSVYCGRKGITYINVETQLGNTAAAREMIAALLQLLGN